MIYSLIKLIKEYYQIDIHIVEWKYGWWVFCMHEDVIMLYKVWFYRPQIVCLKLERI